jgi:hypothetical protein
VALWQDPIWLPHAGGKPGFTIVAVLSLAIGIGANCAIFSFADALLLRPLPVARPGEVYTVGRGRRSKRSTPARWCRRRDYVDIRDRSKSFDGLAAFNISPSRSPAIPGRHPSSRWA